MVVGDDHLITLKNSQLNTTQMNICFKHTPSQLMAHLFQVASGIAKSIYMARVQKMLWKWLLWQSLQHLWCFLSTSCIFKNRIAALLTYLLDSLSIWKRKELCGPSALTSSHSEAIAEAPRLLSRCKSSIKCLELTNFSHLDTLGTSCTFKRLWVTPLSTL